MNNSKSVDSYLQRRSEMGRASRHGDDRLHEDKWMADAKLRGELGCDKANEIIAAVDKIRSYR